MIQIYLAYNKTVFIFASSLLWSYSSLFLPAQKGYSVMIISAKIFVLAPCCLKCFETWFAVERKHTKNINMAEIELCGAMGLLDILILKCTFDKHTN